MPATRPSAGPLYTPPRIVADAAGPAGTLILRSAEPLGAYPATVVHSVRGRLAGVAAVAVAGRTA